MASVNRCVLRVDIGGNECVETHASPNVPEEAVVAVSPAESAHELQPWMVDEDGVGAVQQFRTRSSNLGEPGGLRSSFEAVLSVFPFLLPIVEGKDAVPTSDATLSSGARVRTVEDQPILRAAVKGLSEAAADIAVEMDELRRSGEQLAALLPRGSTPSGARRTDLPKCGGTAICSKVHGGNSIGECSGGNSSSPATRLWCDCVTGVTASIESSVLSVMYEKEALQLFQQDVLDTKFRWWRAVRTCFARGSTLETLDAELPLQSEHKCLLAAGGFPPLEIEGKRPLLQIDMTVEDDRNPRPLQHWACCYFCSPISRAYLLKAHEQLYCVCGKGVGPLLQTADSSAVVSLGDHEATEMSTNDSTTGIFVEPRGKELRGRTGTKSVAQPVALDNVSDALKALRRPRGSAVYNGYGSGYIDLQSDTEKRRRIWQWLWEAAGALGFCASSRFLAMQLLDAYLYHEKCMVDASKTSQVATAAVAAVLLAAASRCHWRDVQNDAFLVALLRNLELPSTADDVIQRQADMLRLLPTFLFTVRSPVDYLVFFLANLRRLPHLLEHSSSLGPTCSQEGRCAEFALNSWANANAHVSQERLSTQTSAHGKQLDRISVSLRRGEEQTPGRAGNASTLPGDAQQSHAQPGKDDTDERRTGGSSGVDAATSTFPILRTHTASHGVTPVKRMISLFDYWKCTGLLGCLEGLILRCCSAFVASGTLCARVPMSRVLAVLLLQVFEPYSRYRLQHHRKTTRGTMSEDCAGKVEVGRRNVSKRRANGVCCFAASTVARWPAGLLEWCRFISINVFRMQFDADLLFWKLVLQPLIDQLLHLPENRPFLLLWQHGVKEWALLLEKSSRETCRNKADGAEGGNTTVLPCSPTAGSFRRGTASSGGQRDQAEH